MNNKGKERGEDSEDQQNVWESIAESWNLYRQRPMKISEKMAQEWKSGKIMDIGCGNCRNLLPFAKKGFDCYGIDFSKKMVKLAKIFLKKEHAKAKIVSEMAEKLPYRDCFFDYCLMIKILPCIKSAEARNMALNELRRVLKNGGKAIITIWNKRNFKYLLSRKEAMVPWGIKPKNGKGKMFMRYYYMYTPSEIQKILISKGFVILDSSNPFIEDYYVVVQKQ